jgi:hypothetical protein
VLVLAAVGATLAGASLPSVAAASTADPPPAASGIWLFHEGFYRELVQRQAAPGQAARWSVALSYDGRRLRAAVCDREASTSCITMERAWDGASPAMIDYDGAAIVVYVHPSSGLKADSNEVELEG